MVKSILEAVGVPYNETMYTKAPKSDFIVYDINSQAGGADLIVLFLENDVRISVYTYKATDRLTEAKLEKELIKNGIEYFKQAKVWLNEYNLFCTNYSFTYFEKIKY